MSRCKCVIGPWDGNVVICESTVRVTTFTRKVGSRRFIYVYFNTPQCTPANESVNGFLEISI